MLDARLGESEFIAGDAFSVADISGFVICDFAKWVKLGIAEAHTNSQRWYDQVAERPSMSA
jgi:glutathione S-transferase